MPNEWLEQFERKLDQLEQTAAGSESSLSAILPAAEEALGCLGAVTDCRVWLVRLEATECLSGSTQADPEDTENVHKACRNESPVTTSADLIERLFISHTLADQTACVLQLNFHSLIAPRSSFVEGVTAVLEVIAGFVSRHLLSQYEAQLQTQMALVSIIPRLHSSATFREAASIVVHDGAPTVGNCRLTIVDCQSLPHRIVAVTGVKDPRQESETLQAVARLTTQANFHQADWNEWRNLDTANDDAERAIFDVLQRSGTQCVQLLPISDANKPQPHRPSCLLVIENFDTEHAALESKLQQLLQATTPALTKLKRAEQGLLTRFIRSRRLTTVAWAALILLLLICIPITLEVEAPGQLNSTQRRRIFAPENGTIDRVLFQNESTVTSGAVLLQMSNPDLELEVKRVHGEIETAATQLAAVQSKRLTDGDAALSGEERQLELQIENLNQQLKLVERQIATLTITAPFAGTTFRRDASRELLARPVQRGQLLLEVVPQDSRWQLELKIPDRSRSYVVNQRDISKKQLSIRYLVVSAPERDWTTNLTAVDNAIQVQDGALVCHATAELTELPEANLRPGTSVIARINCGRRSLGFVMFREVVEFWHRIRFAWL